MSIQEFYSQLTSTHQKDALMATLRRLSQVGNPAVVIAAATGADGGGPWIIWNQARTR